MKNKIRYQAKYDLKWLREQYKLSKEEVADKIGFTVRTLERREKENAVIDEEEAYRLSNLYGIDYSVLFFKKVIDPVWEGLWSGGGKMPENIVNKDSEYYYLCIIRKDWPSRCHVYGKTMWIGWNAGLAEKRILRPMDNEFLVRENKKVQIINNRAELKYWYYMQAIGRFAQIYISKECLQECFPECLVEKSVNEDELFSMEMRGDFLWWGEKSLTFTSLT